MPEIRVTGVYRNFGSFRAIDGIDFLVPHGSFTTLLGPSGCGKTTTLRMLAGFDRPTRGTIRIGDRVVVDASKRSTFVPPQGRELGVVFQSYALWPHMTVYQQVAYPLVSPPYPQGGNRSPGLRRTRDCEATGCRNVAPRRAERRSAAACCPRPRHSHGADHHAPRRAAQQSRRRTA